MKKKIVMLLTLLPLFAFAGVPKAMYALVINGERAQELEGIFIEVAKEEKVQVCLGGLDAGNVDAFQTSDLRDFL